MQDTSQPWLLNPTLSDGERPLFLVTVRDVKPHPDYSCTCYDCTYYEKTGPYMFCSYGVWGEMTSTEWFDHLRLVAATAKMLAG